jgi:FkbM family methyltransferase
MMNKPSVSDFLAHIGSGRPNPNSFVPHLESLSVAMFSYAMSGEDVALFKHFKRKLRARERGTYVDVGCSTPVNISNTYAFYCMGWRGVAIDPNPYVDKWRTFRPEDVYVNAAVAETPGSATLLRHTTNPGMHRISFGAGDVPEGFVADPVPVPVKRLDQVLGEHLSGASIDLMSIDVEGAELSVLRSNDWSRWRPEVIVLECTTFDFEKPYAEPSVAYLRSQGYVLDGKVSANLFLVRA